MGTNTDPAPTFLQNKDPCYVGPICTIQDLKVTKYKANYSSTSGCTKEATVAGKSSTENWWDFAGVALALWVCFPSLSQVPHFYLSQLCASLTFAQHNSTAIQWRRWLLFPLAWRVLGASLALHKQAAAACLTPTPSLPRDQYLTALIILIWMPHVGLSQQK